MQTERTSRANAATRQRCAAGDEEQQRGDGDWEAAQKRSGISVVMLCVDRCLERGVRAGCRLLLRASIRSRCCSARLG